MGNSWKLLLTVVTDSFILNATWLLDVINLDLDSAKNTRNMSNIFKVNNKDTKTMPVAAAINFEHILNFIIAEFEHYYC